MKGRKPTTSKFKRAFIIAAAALGIGGATVTLDNVPKDPVTDTAIVLNEGTYAQTGINISPSDQLWKQTLSMRSQSGIEAELMAAATSGDSWRVQAIFDNGAVSGRSGIATDALAQAAYFGHADVVKTLLSNSVDPTANDGAAMLAAVRGGQTEIAIQLMDLGARVDAQNNEALLLASFRGDYYMVYTLLDRGADPRANDGAALTYAQMFGYEGVASMLQTSIDTKNAIDLQANTLQPPAFSSDLEGPVSPFTNWQYRGPGFNNGPF